uniref:Uncharacterized protein n=1 Tax=candidate division CPR3 bacterium TaxID=2268181 RepID=A0A7V3J9G2_UNCC3
MNGNKLMESLKNVRWDVADKTYGNNHSTLIGLLVEWWISLSPGTNRVLEGGPTNGYKKRGHCDALLCEYDTPQGVLEVEGTYYKKTVQKIGTFFSAKREEFRSLSFGIVLFYSYSLEGRGDNKRFIGPIVPKEEIKKITKKHPEKLIIAITISKKFNKQHSGVRSWNNYYQGELDKIESYLFSKGKEIKCTLLYQHKSS